MGITTKLISLGGKEWKKGDYNRVYVDSSIVESFFGSSHAGFGRQHKVYFDVDKVRFCSSNDRVAENLNCLLDEWAQAKHDAYYNAEVDTDFDFENC